MSDAGSTRGREQTVVDNSGNAGIANWVDFQPARPAGEPAVRDVIGPGFTHGANGPYPELGARGFEAGGPADLMAPCSVLAELTGQALEAGCGRRLTSRPLSPVTPDSRAIVLSVSRPSPSGDVSLIDHSHDTCREMSVSVDSMSDKELDSSKGGDRG